MIKSTWALLKRDERRMALGLLVLMIIGSLLETLGVGLIIPALAVLTDPAVTTSAFPEPLARIMPADRDGMILAGMAALIAVYLIKNLFLAFLAWRQNRFTFDLIASTSERLFVGYLRQPYAFHLQRNSAELIRNIVVEVDVFTGSVVRPMMQLLTESLTMVGLVTLVLIVEPLGAIIVASVAVLAWLAFHLFSRSHVVRWGEARQRHAGLRLQHIQQGLGGVKDVKLLGREADFVEQFRTNTQRYVRVGAQQNTVLELPRLWLELLAVVGLAAVVVTMVAQQRSITAILPTLGLFAAAAFRLMPGLNRIIAGSQALRYGRPVLRTLRDELRDENVRQLDHVAGARIDFTREIRLDHVSFSYADQSEEVLRDISIGVSSGDMVGIIGESGAGKSTLVDIILGLLTPAAGSVLIDGVDIRTGIRSWQNQIGYVPQTIFLTDDTVRRNVAFGLHAAEINDVAVWRALEAAQLAEFIRSQPLGLDAMVGERGVRLSGGQRQRIGIARALYHDPAVLVLDEATSSLDPATEQEVMRAVRALHHRKTILIVSHRFSTVEDCDRLFRLEGGRVAAEGDATAVLRTQANAG